MSWIKKINYSTLIVFEVFYMPAKRMEIAKYGSWKLEAE